MHIYFHFSFQDLKSELSGNFEDACTACMHETAQYEALELRKAMKGAGTNERVLIEIILTRTAEEVFHAHPPIIQKIVHHVSEYTIILLAHLRSSGRSSPHIPLSCIAIWRKIFQLR